MNDTNSWNAYQLLVMDKLDSLETGLEDLRAEVVGVRIDVATLKVKSGVWGAAAGMIPALIVIMVLYLNGGLG